MKWKVLNNNKKFYILDWLYCIYILNIKKKFRHAISAFNNNNIEKKKTCSQWIARKNWLCVDVIRDKDLYILHLYKVLLAWYYHFIYPYINLLLLLFINSVTTIDVIRVFFFFIQQLNRFDFLFYKCFWMEIESYNVYLWIIYCYCFYYESKITNIFYL